MTFSAPGGLAKIRSLSCQGALTITRGARLEFSANFSINGAHTLDSDAPDPSLGTLHGVVEGAPQTMTLAGAFNWTRGTLSGDGVFNADGGITISSVLARSYAARRSTIPARRIGQARATSPSAEDSTTQARSTL